MLSRRRCNRRRSSRSPPSLGKRSTELEISATTAARRRHGGGRHGRQYGGIRRYDSTAAGQYDTHSTTPVGRCPAQTSRTMGGGGPSDGGSGEFLGVSGRADTGPSESVLIRQQQIDYCSLGRTMTRRAALGGWALIAAPRGADRAPTGRQRPARRHTRGLRRRLAGHERVTP